MQRGGRGLSAGCGPAEAAAALGRPRQVRTPPSTPMACQGHTRPPRPAPQHLRQSVRAWHRGRRPRALPSPRRPSSSPDPRTGGEPWCCCRGPRFLPPPSPPLLRCPARGRMRDSEGPWEALRTLRASAARRRAAGGRQHVLAQPQPSFSAYLALAEAAAARPGWKAAGSAERARAECSRAMVGSGGSRSAPRASGGTHGEARAHGEARRRSPSPA